MTVVRTKIGSTARLVSARTEHISDLLAFLEELGFLMESKELRQRLTNRSRLSFMLKASSRIIGFFSCLRESGRWVLDLFVIHPEWRRQGLAKEVVGNLKRRLNRVPQAYLVAIVPEECLEAQVFLRDGAKLTYLKSLDSRRGRCYLFYYRKPRR